MVLLPCVSRASPETAPPERWYLVEMQGKRAGRMVEREETLPDGRIRLSVEMDLAIRRGPAVVELSIESQSVETPGGDLISMSSSQKMGPTTMTTRWEVDPETGFVTVTTVTPAGRDTRRAPGVPAGVLAPAAASRLVADRIANGDESIEVTTFDPSSGLEPVIITRTRIRQLTVEALGKSVPATTWRVEQSVVPGAISIEHLDASGELVRGEISMGGLELIMLRTEREFALAENLDPPELLRSTLVTPSRPIDAARSVSYGRYRLRAIKGDLPDLPSDAAQTFRRVSASEGEVVVDLDAVRRASSMGDSRSVFLAASAMIDSADAEVLALARSALRDAPNDKPARAELLRRAAFRHMTSKNLDVGFATASDAVRTGEGDCTEHAVLLAALLRADGIPSRVASGLIYADAFVGAEDIFGFHMWTQALIEVDGATRWVDLDATLGPSTPTDATHIALSVSPLDGANTINTMAPLAPLLGALEIEVIETR